MRVFADGFWDVPYIRFVPKHIQKLIVWFVGGISSHHRVGLLAHALGREYHGDCEKSWLSSVQVVEQPYESKFRIEFQRLPELLNHP